MPYFILKSKLAFKLSFYNDVQYLISKFKEHESVPKSIPHKYFFVILVDSFRYFGIKKLELLNEFK